MSTGKSEFQERREEISAQIARQRTELAQAFRNLETPIHYAETGLKGFGFLRNNPWIFMATPAVFSMAVTALGWVAGKKSPRSSKQQQPRQQQQLPVENEPKGLKKHVAIWGGRAWQAYQLYRRVRPYFL
jgi:hypothetical protein